MPRLSSQWQTSPGLPGVDAIADAVFARMRDAGLLQPQAPAVVDAQPEPPLQPAVEGALGSGDDINIFVDEYEEYGHKPNASFITQSLPLGYNVVDKTKQQIWNDKYVELGQLVNQHSPTETILFQGPDATFKISTGHKPSKQ